MVWSARAEIEQIEGLLQPTDPREASLSLNTPSKEKTSCCRLLLIRTRVDLCLTRL